MEKEPSNGFSVADFEKFEEETRRFKDALTEEELKVLLYIQLYNSGDADDKLPNQDEIEEVAKDKLRKAGLDADNYERYIELKK